MNRNIADLQPLKITLNKKYLYIIANHKKNNKIKSKNKDKVKKINQVYAFLME